MMETHNLNNGDNAEMLKDLNDSQKELNQIALDLDFGLIEEGNQEYINKNQVKIDRAKSLQVKINFIKEQSEKGAL